jgi:hypothetical protein
VGELPLVVSKAQPPEIFCTLAVKVSVLGNVQVVNFHDDPGTNPSGSRGEGSFTTYTGSGDEGPTCATGGAALWARIFPGFRKTTMSSIPSRIITSCRGEKVRVIERMYPRYTDLPADIRLDLVNNVSQTYGRT